MHVQSKPLIVAGAAAAAVAVLLYLYKVRWRERCCFRVVDSEDWCFGVDQELGSGFVGCGSGLLCRDLTVLGSERLYEEGIV